MPKRISETINSSEVSMIIMGRDGAASTTKINLVSVCCVNETACFLYVFITAVFLNELQKLCKR